MSKACVAVPVTKLCDYLLGGVYDRARIHHLHEVLDIIKHHLNQGREPNCYFYRDSNQHEVDLIIKHGHQLIPIEIKASKTFHPDFLKGLRYFKETVQERSPFGFLIYAGKREQSIQTNQVTHFSQTKAVICKIFEQNALKSD